MNRNSLLSPGYFSSSESENESSSDSDENFPHTTPNDGDNGKTASATQQPKQSRNLLTKLLNREVSFPIKYVLKCWFFAHRLWFYSALDASTAIFCTRTNRLHLIEFRKD